LKSVWYIGASFSLLVSSYLLASQLFVLSPPNAVIVFAGKDSYTCINQNLVLSTLNATISGDNVSNGDWITLGDGKFSPSNSTSGRFSTSTTYVPGPNDRTLGYYRLMLLADPSLLNPNERVQDEVKVTFTSAPPIVCSSNLSISLNETCTQQIQVPMLVPNPQQPFSQYILTIYDKNGNAILDNIVNKNHLGQELSFKLGHSCTSNFCWGKLTVKDYFPPIFNCSNDTINCIRSIEPDSLGWPFPIAAYVDTMINGNFIVKNWDACSDVTLRYTDEVIKGSCFTPVDRRVKRTWMATDAYGNANTCEEWIVINRTNINSISFPSHFDNVINPAFECSDTFPHLANGYPSTDSTGVPYIGSCSHVQYSFTDIPFDLCGDSYKIVRSWFVIDWCSSLSVSKNQFIYILDTHAPEIECLDTLIVPTSIYTCYTGKVALPAPIVVYDCDNTSYDISLHNTANQNISNTFLRKENTTFYVENLPVGHYHVNYLVKDECNNSTPCKMVLVVEDQTEPYVACEQLTKVSVTENGLGFIYATTFDDHSFDNCGIALLRVRRMEENCGLQPAWSDRAIFCCEDMGLTRRVALEVTDVHGNMNTCMVNVEVEDKLKPKITCPPNLTIECDHSYDTTYMVEFGTVRNHPTKVKNVIINNYYHSGVVGLDGLFTDNCTALLDSSISVNVTCFSGQIQRTFTAVDKGNNSASCTQIITVKNPDPFDESDIVPAPAYTGDDCRPDDLKPLVTGQPTYRNTDCATVSASYEDQVFYRADGACIKIIRTWTVVDWCQYHHAGDPGKFGPYIQIIKIHNTDKPSILSSCVDTTICNYDLQCGPTKVTISKKGYDACTADSLLMWHYDVDIYNDGNINLSGDKSAFVGDLPNGTHKITFHLDDQCGNRDVCTHLVTVKDCKAPSPYCLGEISVTIDAQAKSATIWARDFDLGAQDNCTQKKDLIFTFDGALPNKSKLNQRHFFKGNGIVSDTSAYLQGDAQVWLPSTLTSGVYIDCDDIPDGKSAILPLAVSVIDQEGNIDSCTVDVRIQDINNVCPDLITGANIAGRVMTSGGLIVHDVTLSAISSESEYHCVTDTVDGYYMFEDLSLDRGYTITAAKTVGLLDGVSTLDLVKIQRHILSLSPLISPYQLIAADINNSKSVTASDLVDLRKLILGITDRFPKQANPWTFVPADFVFGDPSAPYYYDKTIVIDELGTDLDDQDFVAVKLGDVNESATGDGVDQQMHNREKRMELAYVFDTSSGNIFVTAPKTLQVDGLQLFITGIDTDILNVSSEYFTDIDWHLEHGELAIVATSIVPFDYDGTRPLFSIQTTALRSINDQLQAKSSSELYNFEQSNAVGLIDRTSLPEVVQNGFYIKKNPVVDNVILQSKIASDDMTYSFKISDVYGRVVSNIAHIHTYRFEDQISLPLSKDITPGHYHIQITNQFGYHQVLPFLVVR
jgi:hypothetical protein